ncbi:MAG: D-alanyl-D-alanine carboxypeptidase [Brevundimonas sp.]|jgi:D-alanyl-D-alanine carboxypeptidase|uniref:serine hydrolase n=1 Tax=Brevundimonas sp. TaxID=1871086 RepID=UPI0039E3172C
MQALLFAFVLVAAGLTPTPGAEPVVAQSGENTRYAAIVVDAESGEVLFARRADNPRYPASITKVMTLYMTFEALTEGRIELDDMITVSPRAASQPPSKLGLAAGQRISVEDAIHALTVRSANDIAVAIAEHVGGSEARFAAMSTLRAQELGMTQSRFVNPHGLPDSRQISSARDLAILSRAVMRDYPQYYHYFGRQHWVYNGRQYGNTNGLLHSGNGYDGIKTGFTNASGYNLAASAVRDGRRIITVVLGGRSSRTRNAHVAELMDTGFEVERRRAAGEPIQVAQTFFESRGYGIGSNTPSAPVQYASLDRSSGDEEQSTTAVAFTSAPADTSRVTSSSGSFTAALNGTPSQQADLRPARDAEPARTSGTWAVQVGAFRDRNVADGWLTEVNRRFRSQFAGAEHAVQVAGEWYRSRFTGLTEDSARAACAALAERRVTCMVVRPD